MATSVHVPAVHQEPSRFGSFDGGSPRGVELEDRLDRSLDALIKERKKEEKTKKREEGAVKTKAHYPTATAPAKIAKTKAPTPASSAKKQPHKAYKTASAASVKTQQTVKRNAIVTKNRGLPVVPSSSSNASKNSKTATKKTSKTKTSIAEVTAQLRHKFRGVRDAGQQRASIKSVRKTVSPERIVRKQDKLVSKKPSAQINQKAKKQTTKPADVHQLANTSQRSVVRATSKKGDLKITFSAGNDNKRTRFMNAAATNRQPKTLVKKNLPSKANSQSRKQPNLPKKMRKQAKKSRKHQANAPVVVRQPFAPRKKN